MFPETKDGLLLFGGVFETFPPRPRLFIREATTPNSRDLIQLRISVSGERLSLRSPVPDQYLILPYNTPISKGDGWTRAKFAEIPFRVRKLSSVTPITRTLYEAFSAAHPSVVYLSGLPIAAPPSMIHFVQDKDIYLGDPIYLLPPDELRHILLLNELLPPTYKGKTFTELYRKLFEELKEDPL